VGRPLAGIELRIIKITDDPISVWTDDLVVPDGEIGEIVVAGDVVTKEYFGLPAATAGSKIAYGGRIWHRIGDVGYRDDQGRIWFCGRKAHRVVTAGGTLYSVCCESIFNEHPDVARSALVGVGTSGCKRPVIVVEPKAGRFPSKSRVEEFLKRLRELGRAHDHTKAIEEFLFHKSLPVDVRHNAKINREELAMWAAGRLR
jgi:acyl-CoA synthetase (AMP-forming)/AMP-acid ligase II